MAVISGAAQVLGPAEAPRVEKSLLNTFPFNANEEHDHAHDHHDHDHQHEQHQDLDHPDNIEIQDDIQPEIQVEKEMLVPTIDSIDDDKGQKISDAIFSVLQSKTPITNWSKLNDQRKSHIFILIRAHSIHYG